MSSAFEWLHGKLRHGWVVYLKRLSANDTGASGGHQAGPYIPAEVLTIVAPSLYENRNLLNPKLSFPANFDSPNAPPATVTATWYNNKIVSNKTRNESRVTGWGGRSNSPLLDPDNTGAICALAFESGPDGPRGVHVWICSSPEEEDTFEEIIGPLEPATTVLVRDGTRLGEDAPDPCELTEKTVPQTWLENFPRTEEIQAFALQRQKNTLILPPSQRLLMRRECEYRMFLSLERLVVLPIIRTGFDSVEEFVDYASSVANRRKQRAGHSLELHLKRIFDENRISYSHGKRTEGKKTPDFIFPSIEAYHDRSVPDSGLRMLASKTTCKDRWRQVVNEADRLRNGWKHLFTLQEGVSEPQFREMQSEGVQLVIPEGLRRSYPEIIRGELQSLEGFLFEAQSLGL